MAALLDFKVKRTCINDCIIDCINDYINDCINDYIFRLPMWARSTDCEMPVSQRISDAELRQRLEVCVHNRQKCRGNKCPGPQIIMCRQSKQNWRKSQRNVQSRKCSGPQLQCAANHGLNSENLDQQAEAAGSGVCSEVKEAGVE